MKIIEICILLVATVESYVLHDDRLFEEMAHSQHHPQSYNQPEYNQQKYNYPHNYHGNHGNYNTPRQSINEMPMDFVKKLVEDSVREQAAPQKIRVIELNLNEMKKNPAEEAILEETIKQLIDNQQAANNVNESKHTENPSNHQRFHEELHNYQYKPVAHHNQNGPSVNHYQNEPSVSHYQNEPVAHNYQNEQPANPELQKMAISPKKIIIIPQPAYTHPTSMQSTVAELVKRSFPSLIEISHGPLKLAYDQDQVYACIEERNTHWFFEWLTEETFAIKSSNGRFLALSNAMPGVGYSLNLVKISSPYAIWTIRLTPDGYYVISHASSGLLLSVCPNCVQSASPHIPVILSNRPSNSIGGDEFKFMLKCA